MRGLICRAAVLPLAAAAGLAVQAGLTAPAARAAGSAPSCSAGECAVIFTTAGTGQSLIVPAGVSSLSVTLYGGKGGNGGPYGKAGGDGALVTATLAVSPGDTLGVDVGGAGQAYQPNDFSNGGVNGGGRGSLSGGGGGATDVTLAGTRLLVAGGGGGGGGGQSDQYCSGSYVNAIGGLGGSADAAGQPGQTLADEGVTVGGGGGGQPGTVSGPGAGGAAGIGNGTNSCSYGTNGVAGHSGSGGNGGNESEIDEGGGGGGYFGGGSGGEPAFTAYSLFAGGGGGGGGSSYTLGAGVSGATVNDAGNNGSVNGGNGEAVFSYPDPVSTGSPSYTASAGETLSVSAAGGLLSPAADTSGPAGDTLTAAGPAGGATAQGGTVTVSPDGSFSYTPASGFSGTDSFGYTVVDGSDYAAGTAVITVSAAVATAITVSAPAGGTAGTPIPASSVSAALSGATSGATGAITFTVFGPQSSPPADCATGGTTVGTSAVSGPGSYSPPTGFTPASAGTYWWYASYSGDAADLASSSGCGAGMASTVVTPAPADLSLAASGAPNPVVSGKNLTYTVTTANTGGLAATSVTVTDPLPASVVFGSVATTQGSCQHTATSSNKNKGAMVTCSLGTLAGGSSATVTIVVTPTIKGVLADTASVTAGNVTQDSNDTATTTTTVQGT